MFDRQTPGGRTPESVLVNDCSRTGAETLRSDSHLKVEEADSRRPGRRALPTTSFARRLTPHSVKMSDEIIGPVPQNDIGRLPVRDRVSLLRKGLLVGLRIHRSRKNSIRGRIPHFEIEGARAR